MANPVYWEIAGSPYQSTILDKSRLFASRKHSLCVIDQFSGKRPFLFDDELSSKLQLRLIPTVILDSQVASALHQYRTEPASTPRSQVNSAIKLLWFLAKTNWDYNPFFYCIESASKAPSYGQYFAGVTPTLRSIIELQLMNEDKFRRENVFEIHHEKEISFLKANGFQSVQEAAEKRAKLFWDQAQGGEYFNQIQLSYAALLKMSLIKNQLKQPPFKKMEKLRLFMKKELGCFLAREFHLAYHYFTGVLPRLVIVEKNLKFEKAKKNLRATAWDIFLLRLPELLLANATIDETFIGYPCTAEKELQELGSLFSIERLILRENNAGLIPVLGVKFDPRIENALGLPSKASLDEFSHMQTQDIIQSADKRKPITIQKLNKLVERLEMELKDYCIWNPEDTIYL